MIDNEVLKIIWIFAPVLLVIIGLILGPAITKSRIDTWDLIVESYVEKGEDWCLKEITITSQQERVQHIRSALRRIDISKQNEQSKQKKTT